MADKSTILVVDDIASIREFCQLALTSDDWDVVTASNGQEALTLVEAIRFDLVLLDLGLPDMNGLEVCKQIKASATTGGIPIIAFTGRFPTSEDKVTGFSYGLTDYMLKPLDGHELKARVSSILRQKHEQDSIRQAYATESERTQRIMQEIQDRFLALAENSFDLISEINSQGLLCYCSLNYQEILGLNSTDLIGKKLIELAHPDDVDTIHKAIDVLFSRGGSTRFAFRQKHFHGMYRWFEATAKAFTTADGERRVVLTCRDTSEQKEREDRLNYLASHDLLTGLLNRNALYEALSNYILRARKNIPSVMLFMDMDQLKIVNDTVGHTAGDHLIEEVSGIVRRMLEAEDTFVRFAGDEFIALLGNCSLQAGIERARNICKAVGDFPFTVDSQQFQPRLSIGLTPIDGSKSGEEIVSNADAACYTAKRKGGDRVEVFEESTTIIRDLQSDSEIHSRIKLAVQQDILKLWYMPIVNIATGKVSYFEALLRWQDKDGLWQVPSNFFGVAERYRMAEFLDKHIIKCAIRDLKAAPALKVSINLSGQSLESTSLSDYILENFEDSNIDPQRVTFEITETAFIQNLGHAIEFVRHLQSKKITFALDDFGRGFSSLSQLRDIPVDLIKIDGDFIRKIDSETLNQAIVQSISLIAHQLKRKTVAEYVGDLATYTKITELGVDYAQGYYLGSPRPLSELYDTEPTGSS